MSPFFVIQKHYFDKSCTISKIYVYHNTSFQAHILYFHVDEWLYTGFGLVIGFTELLQNLTASNYSANNNSHNLHFTTARMKSSQSAIFTGCRLVMASNAVAPTASVFTSLLAGDCLTTHSLFQLPGWRPSHTNLLLFSLPSLDSLVIATAPRYIASAWTA
jgi:hypothetical protein